MRNKSLMIWVLCLLILSAGLLLWHHYGMNQTFTLNSNTAYPIYAYDDRGLNGSSMATVKKTPDAIVLACELRKTYAWPYCGFSVSFASNDTQGIDLSRFNSVALDIRTNGPAAMPLRIYLRNFNPAYAQKGKPESLKINQLQYVPHHEAHPLVLSLKRFQVPPWWVYQQNLPLSESARDLSNVTVLEIATGNNATPGDYTISVRSIVFSGKWLDMIQLLSIILALWLVSAAIYLSSSAVSFRRTLGAIRSQKSELEGINKALQLEREELAALATHDELTGLYNRVGLRNQLYDTVSRVKRGEAPLSIIFMDIDYFKAVNDEHGHIAGDEILRDFADFVAERTRDNDFLCRWGGEEFILLCRDTELDDACKIAEKLRVQVAENAWPYSAPLSCSFGIAQMELDEDTGNFLQRADAALYEAKKAGRNRVFSHSGENILPLAHTE